MAKTSAAPLLLAGGAVALAVSKGKKKKKSARGHWGVYVSRDCQKVEITKQTLFRDFVLGGYKELIGIDPDFDIFQISDALYGEVAPHCSPFPENPESPGLAELYRRIVAGVTEAMVTSRNPRVKEMMQSPRAKEFAQWYIHWRNPPSPEIPDAPASEVAFASDYSQFRIGKQWYAETVAPFVKALVKAGNANQIYDAFISNRAVVVGRALLPINTLPVSQPMVEQFLGQVRAAVDQALAESGR